MGPHFWICVVHLKILFLHLTLWFYSLIKLGGHWAWLKKGFLLEGKKLQDLSRDPMKSSFIRLWVWCSRNNHMEKPLFLQLSTFNLLQEKPSLNHSTVKNKDQRTKWKEPHQSSLHFTLVWEFRRERKEGKRRDEKMREEKRSWEDLFNE